MEPLKPEPVLDFRDHVIAKELLDNVLFGPLPPRRVKLLFKLSFTYPKTEFEEHRAAAVRNFAKMFDAICATGMVEGVTPCDEVGGWKWLNNATMVHILHLDRITKKYFGCAVIFCFLVTKESVAGLTLNQLNELSGLSLSKK